MGINRILIGKSKFLALGRTLLDYVQLHFKSKREQHVVWTCTIETKQHKFCCHVSVSPAKKTFLAKDHCTQAIGRMQRGRIKRKKKGGGYRCPSAENAISYSRTFPNVSASRASLFACVSTRARGPNARTIPRRDSTKRPLSLSLLSTRRERNERT